jgi:hypothetical protein
LIYAATQRKSQPELLGMLRQGEDVEVFVGGDFQGSGTYQAGYMLQQGKLQAAVPGQEH